MGASSEEASGFVDRSGCEAPVAPMSASGERARWRVRRQILAWWLLTLALGWGFTASMLVMAVRGRQGAFEVVVTGLAFAWLTRRTARTVGDVWRPESYPARHWEMASGWFGCLPIAIGVVGLLIVAAASIVDGFLRADEVDFPALAGAALGFFLFLLWIASNVHEGFHHVRAIPYFQKRVGEIDTYLGGSHVALHLRELDGLAGSIGVQPLSNFGWNDDLCGEELAWHSSAEGLKTVNALLVHLQVDEFGGSERAGVIDDLKRMAHALDRADRSGIDFCLILKQGNTTSGAEHDARKGTFD